MDRLFIFSLLSIFIFACSPQAPERPEKIETPKPLSPAAQLAQAQLDAYNNMDIEGFLLPYSDSVKVYGTLGELSYTGSENMRSVYTQWFGGLDSLHCTLLNRIVSGNTVIDHEKLSFRRRGLDGVNSSEAIAIYKIEGDKIVEVRFTK